MERALTAFDEEQAKQSLRDLIDRREVLEIKMRPFEVHLLIQALQMTVTHPALGAPIREYMTVLGHILQEQLRPLVDENFAIFTECGWHREFDGRLEKE